MATESADVLMTFIDDSNSGVPAECGSVWNVSDSMKADFTAGTFFEIDDFSLGGGLESSDGSSPDKSPPGGRSAKMGNDLSPRNDPGKKGKDHRDDDQSKAARGGRGGKYEAYIVAADNDASWQRKLRLDVPEISLSRQIDSGSPLLFAACMNLQAFTKAVIVKRKVIGTMAVTGAGVPLMGFLRLEFTKPLITSIDWEDGDVVKEKIKFVCRGIMMTYKPQRPDGSLGTQISVTWTPKLSTRTGGS